MDVVDTIVEIAERRAVLEVAHDPWRFPLRGAAAGARAPAEDGGDPDVGTRMGQMSENLHSRVVSKRLTHPDHPVLNRHAANAVAVETRGWQAVESQPMGFRSMRSWPRALPSSGWSNGRSRREPKLLGWL